MHLGCFSLLMAILEAQVGRRSPATQIEKSWQIDRKPLSPSGRNNGSQAHEIKKMGLKEVNRLKGARKERKSKPWAIYDVKK